MNSRALSTKVFSGATVFFLLGFFLAISVAWYKVTPIIVWCSYLVTSACSFLFYRQVRSRKNSTTSPLVFEKYVPVFTHVRALEIVYMVGWIGACTILFQSRGVGILFSPWQTIPTTFLILFLVLSIIFGVLLFSNIRTKVFLILLILHSVLMHFYLPLSHENPWGGDVWRMIAVEEKLSRGEAVLPVLFGPEALVRTVFGVGVPEALIIPHKYIYSHLWGTTILLEKTIGVDLIVLNKWLVPILWSVLMPLIMYRIGVVLFQSRRMGRIVSSLAFLFFPLQALGGLTLAVSFGTVFFFFILMLYLQYLRDGDNSKRSIVLFFILLSLFGYTLYFLLLIFLYAGIFLLRKIIQMKSGVMRKAGVTVLAFVGVFLFPVVELLSRSSYFSDWDTVGRYMKQMIGQFSGWVYASAIRPHDIFSGNILFNHTPEIAYVLNIFTDFRWHLAGALIIFLSASWYGIWHLCAKEKRIEWHTIGFLAAVVMGGYMIGWFVLSGDRSFVRRLDPVFSILVILLSVYGLRSWWYTHSFSLSRTARIAGVVVCSVFLSWVATSVFVSGPDMRVVSVSERDVAHAVFVRMSDMDAACVIADMWPLLALEGLSGQRIVAGGFPQDYLFAQPERTFLYTEMVRDPRRSIVEVAQRITGAASCAIIVPEPMLTREKVRAISAFMQADPEQIGDLYVWVPGIEK